MKKQTINLLGWGLTAIAMLILAASAAEKIIGGESALKTAAAIGLSPAVYRALGIIELASAILFAFPRTGILGTLLLASYLGGAIATRLQHQENILVPVIIAAAVWIAAFVRFPELTSRWNAYPPQTPPLRS